MVERSHQCCLLFRPRSRLRLLSLQFLCVLCVLLLLQAVALTMALIFEKKVNAFLFHTSVYTPNSRHRQVDHAPCVFCQTSALFQSSIREGIKHYYDDLDFKNILDYVQQKVILKITMSRIHCVGGRHSELLFLLPVALLDRLTHHRFTCSIGSNVSTFWTNAWSNLELPVCPSSLSCSYKTSVDFSKAQLSAAHRASPCRNLNHTGPWRRGQASRRRAIRWSLPSPVAPAESSPMWPWGWSAAFLWQSPA